MLANKPSLVHLFISTNITLFIWINPAQSVISLLEEELCRTLLYWVMYEGYFQAGGANVITHRIKKNPEILKRNETKTRSQIESTLKEGEERSYNLIGLLSCTWEHVSLSATDGRAARSAQTGQCGFYWLSAGINSCSVTVLWRFVPHLLGRRDVMKIPQSGTKSGLGG